ncbi:MAG: molybdenum cofactor guanylyltransferase, partial [Candidatus Bathyarchaeia archaeon]
NGGNMTKRAAVILAGGEAKRFQTLGGGGRDKALIEVSGKTMLQHIIEGISDLVDEILICVNNLERKSRYQNLLRGDSLIDKTKIVIDLNYPLTSGPLVAITTGLKASIAEYCIILPCDTPFIQSEVADFLFKACGESDIAAPVHPDGTVETIMFVCRRPQTASIAEILCKMGRKRPDDLIRGSSIAHFISTYTELKPIDPEFKSFININSPKDLAQPKTRVKSDGPFKKSIKIRLGAPNAKELEMLEKALENLGKSEAANAIEIFSELAKEFEEKQIHFWAGICRENLGKTIEALLGLKADNLQREWVEEEAKAAFLKAARNYSLEAEIYRQNSIYHLAKHAQLDEEWCRRKSSAGNSDKQ